MSGNLKGKVALVTGASRGIGKGIAIGLGEGGALVYITGRSVNADNSTDSILGSLLDTKSLVEKAGGICIAVPVDHSDDQQIKSLFEQIDREQNGKLDLLVNNAYGGVRSLINAKGKAFWESDLSLWDACNQVGLRISWRTQTLRVMITMLGWRRSLINLIGKLPCLSGE